MEGKPPDLCIIIIKSLILDWAEWGGKEGRWRCCEVATSPRGWWRRTGQGRRRRSMEMQPTPKKKVRRVMGAEKREGGEGCGEGEEGEPDADGAIPLHRDGVV